MATNPNDSTDCKGVLESLISPRSLLIYQGIKVGVNMEQKKLLSSIFISLIFFVFIVGSVYAAQKAVNLGTAGDFVILSKSGISTTGTTSIVGDIGVSPIDSTAITGFGLILDSSNQFATSSLVTGKIYAADYAPSTPTRMTTAVSDMETAYTDAAGRTLPDYTELGAGNIGGMTLTPGLYKWGTGVTIPTNVTLAGNSTDVWIFQIAQTLGISNGQQVILSGGAQPKNIFWQVAGQTTLGTTSVFN
ncbi:MAG: ice-binding family protein, partial [archaeon]|nr:ice-binding family protein [archaeon]